MMDDAEKTGLDQDSPILHRECPPAGARKGRAAGEVPMGSQGSP